MIELTSTISLLLCLLASENQHIGFQISKQCKREDDDDVRDIVKDDFPSVLLHPMLSEWSSYLAHLMRQYSDSVMGNIFKIKYLAGD